VTSLGALGSRLEERLRSRSAADPSRAALLAGYISFTGALGECPHVIRL
jgi:hypothetical protein